MFGKWKGREVGNGGVQLLPVGPLLDGSSCSAFVDPLLFLFVRKAFNLSRNSLTPIGCGSTIRFVAGDCFAAPGDILLAGIGGDFVMAVLGDFGSLRCSGKNDKEAVEEWGFSELMGVTSGGSC